MTSLFYDVMTFIALFLQDPFSSEAWQVILRFIPFILFLEVPIYIIILLGILKYGLLRINIDYSQYRKFPSVSCIVTCYNEREEAKRCILSLAEQFYPGRIQIVAVIDGASQNKDTYEAAKYIKPIVDKMPDRDLVIIPKWKRGGRVSSLNAGLNLARGEIVMALDGDTSFDNNMVERATRHFEDPNVIAVGGSLRVRNFKRNLITRLQAIEYLLSIQTSRTGLSAFNMVNNISGAFGVFRKRMLDTVMGWDTGSAEDLDMTIRIKKYFGRYKNLKIIFDPEAIGHTDVPDTLNGFLRQRLRWDGDIPYLYFRKHWRTLSPKLMGWKNFLATIWTGLFFQVVMPFSIIVYTIYLFVSYRISFVLGIFSLIYLFYLALTTMFFIIFVLILSQKPGKDMKLLPWIVFSPLFSFVNRVNNAFATLWEFIGRGHEDTSMTPWWVLSKRG